MSTHSEGLCQHQGKGEFGLRRRVWCHPLDQCGDRTNGSTNNIPPWGRKEAASERRTRFFNRKSSSAFLSQKLYVLILEIIDNTDEQNNTYEQT